MDQRRLLYWCDDAWKEHLFYVRVSLIVVRKYSGSCTGTQVTNVSHSGFSLGGIPEGYSDSPQVTSEANKVKGEELDVK